MEAILKNIPSTRGTTYVEAEKLGFNVDSPAQASVEAPFVQAFGKLPCTYG